MADDSVAERIRQILANNLDRPVEEVTDDKSFEDLGADSLDALEALMDVEDGFDVNINGEGLTNATTIGEFITTARRKING